MFVSIHDLNRLEPIDDKEITIMVKLEVLRCTIDLLKKMADYPDPPHPNLPVDLQNRVKVLSALYKDLENMILNLN